MVWWWPCGKDLFFAADGVEPEVVLRDAVNSDVEIVRNAGACPVFTDSLAPHGPTWRQMVVWWTKDHQCCGRIGSPGWRYCPRMDQLPCTSEALVVRTDFSADAAWDALRAALLSPGKDGFLANVAFVDDRRYDGLTLDQALGLLPAEYQHPLLVLADSVAVASTEQPLLVVDLRAERGRCVRVVAAELWSIENNVSGANMDFEEFDGAVDDDGVFRGF